MIRNGRPVDHVARRRAHQNRRLARGQRHLTRQMVPRYLRAAIMPNYTFKVKGSPVEYVTTNGVYLGANYFTLGDIPNTAEFTALFDQYRIKSVVVKFSHRSTALSLIETINNNQAGMPVMYHVIDLDDATTPTTFNELREYGYCKTFYFTPDKRVFSRKITPRALNAVYRDLVTTGYALAKKNTWYDCTQTNIRFYGQKWGMDVPQAGGTAVNASFDLETTYVVEFKRSR